MQEDVIVVSVDPGNKYIMAIAVSKSGKDGIDCNLRQKDMQLLKLSIAKYYRESGIMHARKKSETWNWGVKEHLEAISQMTSRGADFQAFLELMKIRAAHYEALWKEYTETSWARQRTSLCGEKKRAFTNFFNQLGALKVVKSQRLVAACGTGRWASKKGTFQLHLQERTKSTHIVFSQYLWMSSERHAYTMSWGVRSGGSWRESVGWALMISKITES